MRQKVGQAYSKFSFFHGIAANATTGSLLQNFMDEVAKAGPGVKTSTTYEVMGKYLDHKKELLNGYIGGLKKKWLEYEVIIMCDGWTGPTK